MNEENLLSKLSETERSFLFELYEKYSKSYTKIRYIIFSVIAIILLYNLLFAGKRFSISDYNAIQGVFSIIIILILILLIFVSIPVFKTQSAVKRELRRLSTIHSFTYKSFKKEFNKFIKKQVGGVRV